MNNPISTSQCKFQIELHASHEHAISTVASQLSPHRSGHHRHSNNILHHTTEQKVEVRANQGQTRECVHTTGASSESSG
jgi:hypothetical protein